LFKVRWYPDNHPGEPVHKEVCKLRNEHTREPGTGTDGRVKVINVTGDIEFDPRCREWCKLPYVGHPKGCPNFGKTDRCPPTAPLVTESMDLSREHYFVIHEFDLESHRNLMLEKHPGWTVRQANCVLYWQRTQRKLLKEECEKFITQTDPRMVHNFCPEAEGVNIFKILRRKGIKIVARPQKTVYMVALVGFPKNAISKIEAKKLTDFL